MKWRGPLLASFKNSRPDNAGVKKVFPNAWASRSELDCDHTLFPSTIFTARPFRGLNRHMLDYPWDSPISNNFARAAHKSTLQLFSTGDALASSPHWREELLQDVREPDGKDILSVLRHSHAAVNGTLSKFPGARYARISHSFGTNALRCVASRDDSLVSLSDRTMFNLRITTSVDGGTIGPRKLASDTVGSELTIDISMMAKPTLFSPRIEDANEKFVLSLGELTMKLVRGLKHALRGRKFTSHLSRKEAIAIHLEGALNSLALRRYVNFEGVTLTGFIYGESHSTQWLHERSRSKALPYLEPVGMISAPNGFKPRLESSATIDKASIGAMTHIEHTPREMIRCRLYSFTVDLSVLAQSLIPYTLTDVATCFEKRFSKSPSKDLASILDSFLVVEQMFPKHVNDPVTIRISHEAPEALTELTEPTPTFNLELRQANAPGHIDVSLHADLHKSFKISVESTGRKKRTIEVEQISFRLSPIDAAAAAFSKNSSTHDQPPIELEARHLVDRASSVIGQICGAVEFDDVALVPGMLAEAVLRVVRPKNTCTKLEKVSLGVVVGDDPVVLTKTVSLTDLGAPSKAPSNGTQRYTPYVDDVHFPSRYSSNITHQSRHRPPLPGRIGSFRRMMQLISSPITDYESGRPLQRLLRRFETALKQSMASDVSTLQVLVQRALKNVQGGEDAVLILAPPWEHGVSNAALIHEEAAIVVYSEGDVVFRLQTFEQTFWYAGDSEPIPIKCQLSLTGTPIRQTYGSVDAQGQMSFMHEVLARKLAQTFNDRVFLDVYEAANKITEVCYDARSELAKHLIVDVTTARVRYADPSSASTQDNTVVEYDEDRRTQTGEDPEMPASDIDDSDLEQSNMQGSSDSPVDGKDLEPEFYSPALSKEGSDHDLAVALKALLRELDENLLTTTSLHSDPQPSPSEAMHRTESASDASFTSNNLERGFYSLTLSKESSEHDHAAALKDLLRDLDGKIASFPSKMQRGVVIALGSNLGNRIEEIEKACRAIDADPDMRIVDTSFLYETKPMYVEDQGEFVNGACEIETSLSPIQLLDRLQAIEQGHGRVKLVDKGPRNIDLDIAIFRDQVVETERLIIPHMLMHEREFVLRPIMDLDQMREWRNPRTKMRMETMFGNANQPKREQQHQEPMRVITPLTTDAFIYPSDKCRKTRVMSILNTTPDSFSDGGSNALDLQSLKNTAAAHIAAGATIIDVGGQSSRPNAPDVTTEEEISRVLPAIAAIKSLPEAEGITISVDTYRAAVAEAAVDAGAHVVNDISSGALDPEMLSTVARLGCTYVMMHMRGTPATMQDPQNCVYEHGVCATVASELDDHTARAVESGIRKWRIILDPGIGFAKTEEQNLELLRRKMLGNAPQLPSRLRRRSFTRLSLMPVLYGCSRKGFIGNITGAAEPKDRAWGTAAAVAASVRVGADIVRVHDVKEMAQVAKMSDAIFRVDRSVLV